MKSGCGRNEQRRPESPANRIERARVSRPARMAHVRLVGRRPLFPIARSAASRRGAEQTHPALAFVVWTSLPPTCGAAGHNRPAANRCRLRASAAARVDGPAGPAGTLSAACLLRRQQAELSWPARCSSVAASGRPFSISVRQRVARRRAPRAAGRAPSRGRPATTNNNCVSACNWAASGRRSQLMRAAIGRRRESC
jgi:hypothetical protein